MRSFTGEISIFKVGALPQAAFTMDTTKTITSNAHGLSVGDCLQFTTATTLPAGLSLVTNYYVTSITTNTFEVSAVPGGTVVTSTDAGTDTHTYHLKGKKIYCGDWNNLQIGFYTASSANMTVKFLASDQEDVDFNASQSSTNRWDYMQSKDLQNNASIDGDTGVSPAGADDNRSFEININGKKYITAQITSWSAGKINLIATMFND